MRFILLNMIAGGGSSGETTKGGAWQLLLLLIVAVIVIVLVIRKSNKKKKEIASTVFCAKCGAPLPQGGSFCPGCGAQAAAFCAKCGAPLPQGDSFCSGCGAQAAEPSPAVYSPGAAPGAVADRPSGGMAALGFFIPLAGFIVYGTQHLVVPLRAKSALKGAIAGMIFYVVASVLAALIPFLLF